MIPFAPGAESEFLSAVAHYVSIGRSVGESFTEEFQRATERISTFPEHGQRYLLGTRRVVLQQFPFSVVYDSRPGGLRIIALAHHRRKPGYWRRRLRSL